MQERRLTIKVSFVVNLEALRDENDLSAGGIGPYQSHGAPKDHCYLVYKRGRIRKVRISRQNPFCKEELEEFGLENAEHVVLERTYSKLRASPDFMRVIFRVSSPETSSTQSLAFVQYRFSRTEHTLPSVPHGNSKSQNTLVSTQKSTSKELKKVAETHIPSQAVAKIFTKVGGYMQAASSSELPRNLKQASNFRCKIQPKENRFTPSHLKQDELLLIMENVPSLRPEKIKCLSGRSLQHLNPCVSLQVSTNFKILQTYVAQSAHTMLCLVWTRHSILVTSTSLALLIVTLVSSTRETSPYCT